MLHSGCHRSLRATREVTLRTNGTNASSKLHPKLAPRRRCRCRLRSIVRCVPTGRAVVVSIGRLATVATLHRFVVATHDAVVVPTGHVGSWSTCTPCVPPVVVALAASTTRTTAIVATVARPRASTGRRPASIRLVPTSIASGGAATARALASARPVPRPRARPRSTRGRRSSSDVAAAGAIRVAVPRAFPVRAKVVPRPALGRPRRTLRCVVELAVAWRRQRCGWGRRSGGRRRRAQALLGHPRRQRVRPAASASSHRRGFWSFRNSLQHKRGDQMTAQKECVGPIRWFAVWVWAVGRLYLG